MREGDALVAPTRRDAHARFDESGRGTLSASAQRCISPLACHCLRTFLRTTRRSRLGSRRRRSAPQRSALNMFDDYLLLTKAARGRENEESGGGPIEDVEKIPNVLDVHVRNPWVHGRTLWLHVVYVSGRPFAGIVTGTPLPPVELVASDLFLSADEPREVVLEPRHGWSQRRAMVHRRGRCREYGMSQYVVRTVLLSLGSCG